MTRYLILIGGISLAIGVLVFTHYVRNKTEQTMTKYEWIIAHPADKSRTPLTNQYVEWRLECNGDCR